MSVYLLVPAVCDVPVTMRTECRIFIHGFITVRARVHRFSTVCGTVVFIEFRLYREHTFAHVTLDAPV